MRICNILSEDPEPFEDVCCAQHAKMGPGLRCVKMSVEVRRADMSRRFRIYRACFKN